MSDKNQTETDTSTDNTDEPSKAELHDRVQQLESTVAKMMPSRRDALRFGAAGIAGAAGLGAASQPADASTGSAGTIGSTSDRPDLIADDVGPRSIAGDYLYAGEFSGSNPDSRLDSCLTAASEGSVIYLESGDYTQNRTISKQALRLVGVAAGSVATGIEATITLSGIRTSIMHVSLQSSNVLQGEIIFDGGRFARHLAMNTVLGEIIINSGTERSMTALTRSTTITDNGSNNTVVGNGI